MQPRELLAETATPDGRRMTLSRHAGDHTIEVDGQALMSSRAPGSERALAELAARELSTPAPSVLIGGLGLGFTLGAALTSFPRKARIVVAELFAPIVEWNRRFEFDPTARLDDRRVKIVVGDVADQLARPRAFDAILLDVDNGPGAWTLDSNAGLYDRRGLGKIARALRPGGLLAVWSAEGSPAFLRALANAGYSARAERVRSRGRRGEHHTIFLARI